MDVTTVPMACVVPVSLGLGSRAAVPKALGCRYKSDGRAGGEAAAGAGASTSCRRVSVSATLGAAGQGQRGGADSVSIGGRGVGARGFAQTARAGSAGAGAGVVQLPGLGADGQTWDPLGLGQRSRRPHVNRDLGAGPGRYCPPSHRSSTRSLHPRILR